MTLTRQKRHKRAFAMGKLFDHDGNLIRNEMPKWEARLMFRGLQEEDAIAMGFWWVPDEGYDTMTWDDVHGA